MLDNNCVMRFSFTQIMRKRIANHMSNASVRKVRPHRSEAPRKPEARSRVSNGSVLLPDVDGRSTWVRRCRDIIELHIADLGGDGAISEAERSIVRRVSVLAVELERLEQKFALAGEASAVELDLYSRVAGNLRRLLESIGLQRRAVDVTPTLDQYLRSRHGDSVEAAS